MNVNAGDRLWEWIAVNMPEVGPLSRLRVKVCRKIPFSWIPGYRHIQGLTLWNRIYIREGFVDPTLVFHELTHVAQFRRSPLLFPIKYVIDHIRYGYVNNPAEIEARERAAELSRMFRRIDCD